uniref:hypothetical protein n=1 Tax=Streptomyces sp. CA-141956 TaxID=3240051 RepID=UPI003F493D3C
MASRISENTAVVMAAAAGTSITTQVWMSGASLSNIVIVAFLAATSTALVGDIIRRNRAQHTVTCPQAGCSVQISMSGVTPDEQSRLIALAVDHSRHGGDL